MKNTKTKIVLSVIIFLSVVVFVSTVGAAGAFLYVSPTTIAKTAGDTFSVSVGVNTSDSKVCVVEGTLVFNNLSCQSITVASDVMAQFSPTCSTPHFLIGIPNCVISDKTLLTVSVKAGSAGTASIGFSGVDVIGEGVSIFDKSNGGNYNILSKQVIPQETITQQIEEQEITENVSIATTKEKPSKAVFTPAIKSSASMFDAFVLIAESRALTIILVLLISALGIICFREWLLFKEKSKK